MTRKRHRNGPFSVEQEGSVLEHDSRVKRIARRIHWRYFTYVDVADLVQEGWIGLLKSWIGYDEAQGSFERFSYYGITGAMFDSHRRRSYRNEKYMPLDARLVARLTSNGPLPDEIAARREEAQLLVNFLGDLSNNERRVLLASLDRVPLDDIAVAFNRSPAWVRSKRASAIRKVQTRMTKTLGGARSQQTLAVPREFVRPI
jgi:RNA polymerase sigma factor (sigma-70 family)